MKMRIIIAVLIVAGLIGVGVAAFFKRPMWLFYSQELRTGSEIISRVKTFRRKYGKLPETLREVGYEDTQERVFYTKLSPDEYCLWFGTGLGQSETYRSRVGHWEEGRECVDYAPR
jgi:hypothetical protein